MIPRTLFVVFVVAITLFHPYGLSAQENCFVWSGDATDDSGMVIVLGDPLNPYGIPMPYPVSAWTVGSSCMPITWISKFTTGNGSYLGAGVPATQLMTRHFCVTQPEIDNNQFVIHYSADDQAIVVLNGTELDRCVGSSSYACFPACHTAPIPNGLIRNDCTNTLDFYDINRGMPYMGAAYKICMIPHTPTPTETYSPTPILSPTFTATPTETLSLTPTFTLSWTSTSTPTETATPTPTPTSTPTTLYIPILTPTATATFSACRKPLFVSANAYYLGVDTKPLRIRAKVCVPGIYSLLVYNTAGERIKVLRDFPYHSQAEDEVGWDGSNNEFGDVSSGVYIIVMTVANGAYYAKVVVIR